MRQDDEAKDFLAHCVATTTGNPQLEQIRDQSANAALAVFRLVKNALVHSTSNEAFLKTAEQSQQILASFAAEVGTGAVVTFVGDSVFVCGQLLRASRKIYEATLELGKLLARCGVSEVSFSSELTQQNLVAFGDAVAIAARDPERRAALLEANVANINVRKIDTVLQQRQDDSEAPLTERILRTYALALMVMRGFFEGVAAGHTLVPHRVKRISQRLVTLSEHGHPATLGVTAMANTHRDDAGRAVQSAVLSLAVARQLTHDRVSLARMVMGALMCDVGRVRLVGHVESGSGLALPPAMDASVPATTGALSLITGGINVQNALRTVILTEATWLEREASLGSLFHGKAPLPQAQILAMVRRLLDMVAPRDGRTALSPAAALQELAAQPEVDRLLLRLLVRAVGLLPAGSVIEFETGEWGVIVGPSRNPETPHLYVLRVVTDRQGRSLDPPREFDLGQATGRALPRIVNVIEPRRARFNVTRTFLN